MVPAMSADETMRKAAGRLLAWYEAMGVDAALEEHPLDWLGRGGVSPGAQFSLQTGVSSDVAPAALKAEPFAGSPRQAYAPAAAPATKPARQFPARAPAAPEAAARIDLDGARTLAELRCRTERL